MKGCGREWEGTSRDLLGVEIVPDSDRPDDPHRRRQHRVDRRRQLSPRRRRLRWVCPGREQRLFELKGQDSVQGVYTLVGPGRTRERGHRRAGEGCAARGPARRQAVRWSGRRWFGSGWRTGQRAQGRGPSTARPRRSGAARPDATAGFRGSRSRGRPAGSQPCAWPPAAPLLQSQPTTRSSIPISNRPRPQRQSALFFPRTRLGWVGGSVPDRRRRHRPWPGGA